jgi:hypothetical protein
MGKRKGGSKYVHNHSYNPRAHESKERKLQLIKNLEIKRLRVQVQKNLDSLRAFYPLGSKIQPIGRIDIDKTMHSYLT